MKTFDITHEEIIDPSNLLEADRNASQGKHNRDENLKFSAHREEEIIDLTNRLTYYPKDGIPGNPLESSYRVGKYRMKQIYEPKPPNYHGFTVPGSCRSMGVLPETKPFIRPAVYNA